MKHFILFSIIALSLSSCNQRGCMDPDAINHNSEANKDDGSCDYEERLNIEFELSYNGNRIEQYDSFEKDGNNFRLERCSYYLSHLSLDDTYLKEVHLYNLEAPSTHLISSTLDKAAYNELSFGLGLDATLNASDASSFSADHPLSLAQNTFWQMDPPSYIFIKLEVKVDTLGGENFNHLLTYHLAHNELYRSISLSNLPNYDTKNTLSIKLNLAIDQAFNNVNIQEELPHSSNNSPLAQQLTNNIADAFIIE